MQYWVNSGVYRLDYELSSLERSLFREFEDELEKLGFQYLSIPSLITWQTFNQQQIDKTTLTPDKQHCLAGSAEQGILEFFSNKVVSPTRLYAKNQCFREEDYYEGLKRCKEFIKLEQYCFCYKQNWHDNFELLLANSTNFLSRYDISYRVVDVTKKDVGYHIKKYDIEIKTKQYGWLETHSCSYFGEEQSKRFNIKGATHTLSNTGIASPRILIPFIEKCC